MPEICAVYDEASTSLSRTKYRSQTTAEHANEHFNNADKPWKWSTFQRVNMKWKLCHLTSVCGNWYQHEWRSPSNATNTGNVNHNVTLNKNNHHNKYTNPNTQYIQPQAQHIATPLLLQSKKTFLRMDYNNVRGVSSHCNNDCHHPLWS